MADEAQGTGGEDGLQEHLIALYGAASGARLRQDLDTLIARWRAPLRAALGEGAGDHPRLDQRQVVVIAYGDHLRRDGEAPLSTLAGWCREHLKGLASTIHVLPFHPSTSYEGYAITDYMAVDPALGSWDDLARLGEDFDLMFDLVLNHCSASHPWFLQLLADEDPGRGYFLTVEDPGAPWLAEVRRARNLPLVHPFETAAGTRHVWTTYSPDLIDLNWREPAVCCEFLEVLLDSVVRGARVVRLDAFVYTWKQEGTDCVALPETHRLLRVFQEVLARAGAGSVAILPSITNVTQARNYTYLAPEGGDRQADLVYHLPLSALLLLGLYRADAGPLARWLSELPEAPPGRAYLNLAATHDGIGLTWLKDLLPEETVRELIDAAEARGALLSSRKDRSEGDDLPWEINATWFSACAPAPGSNADHVAAFLATQGVVLALRGVPALYLPLLLAGRNDHPRVERTGDPRAVNRGRFDLDSWSAAAARGHSDEARVLAGMRRMLAARRECAAFHPEGGQRVLDLGIPAVLALERRAPEGGSVTVCLVNLADEAQRVPAGALAQGRDAAAPWRDLLGGAQGDWDAPLSLAPFQVRWLEEQHGS